jgi:hypothetical protein
MLTGCRATSPACALALMLLAPVRAEAWGFEVHQFIMDRAIALLPGEVRPLFERHRAVVVERAIDPDTWITTGGFDEERPRHFLNLDADGYGAYPFRELPRDYAGAVAKFGASRVTRNGTLPWRADEIFDRLRAAFGGGRAGSRAGELDAIRLAAALSHYIADAHVPFHAVTNYDGQLTGQRGIHARFETTLFARMGARLAMASRPRAPIRAPRDAVFDALIEGTRLVPAILRADRAARSGTAYDDAYYAAFFRDVGPILEQRINESIAAVAATIAGAWEAADRK